LSQGELLALFLAERMMRQFRGTPFDPDLEVKGDLGIKGAL
jgi:hypothetical protein